MMNGLIATVDHDIWIGHETYSEVGHPRIHDRGDDSGGLGIRRASRVRDARGARGRILLGCRLCDLPVLASRDRFVSAGARTQRRPVRRVGHPSDGDASVAHASLGASVGTGRPSAATFASTIAGMLLGVVMNYDCHI